METKAEDDAETTAKNEEPAPSKPEALPVPEPEPDPDHAPGGAEVVRLDRFRKK
jgi:hypothetical protein